MESVIINGVRYVSDEQHPDTVKFYFMHDNHTFTRLYGTSLDEVLAHADEVEASEDGSYGMLCPPILLRGTKEVRRSGAPAHARGSKDPKDHWNAGKAAWRAICEADADVMRLLPSNASFSGGPEARPAGNDS